MSLCTLDSFVSATHRAIYPLLSLVFVSTLPQAIHAGDIVDLRDGAPTTFYGGGFGPGTGAGDYFGWAFAFGDIDGDGLTDFLSSSANSEGPNDQNLTPEKDVYVYFGRPRVQIDSLIAVDQPGGADIVIYKGGFGMACADLDADGFDDMVLAELPVGGDPVQGGVYVIFGAPRDSLRSAYNFKVGRPDYTPPDVYIGGSTKLGGAISVIQNAYFDFVSRSLGTGDLNGDGFADIVIGDIAACAIPGACQDGAAYIIFGRPRSDFPTTISVDPRVSAVHPDVTINGDEAERYPTNLAIGDIDGDSIDDLLISTTYGSGDLGLMPRVGEIDGWWGRSDWSAMYNTQIDAFDFAIEGVFGNPLGYRIVLGDLDGDGRQDIVSGSPYETHGEYRVFFGRPRGLWPVWSNMTTSTDVLLRGGDTTEILDSIGPFEWGFCLSLATGNTDGDHYDDLLIGAGFKPRPGDGSRPGGAYLVKGRPRSEWRPLIDLTDEYDSLFMGAESDGTPGYAKDRLGFVVGMGDIDGDRLDDIFLAAPFADGPQNAIPDCGEVYLFYGESQPSIALGDAPRAPSTLFLDNFPNPFSTSTSFHISSLPEDRVTLTIYDVHGRRVTELSQVPAGADQVLRWQPRDGGGRQLASGVYFARLRSTHGTVTRKLHVVH